jgi:hypothetical protein
MNVNATESIARQHIQDLHDEAAARRRLRGDRVARRTRQGAGGSARTARTAREAIGYRLVVLGWRLLDGSPRVAGRTAS